MSMIGQLATSKAGHDKGSLYVIVGCREDFVYLCDGRSKTPDSPKKKRRRHIQPINEQVDNELLSRLQDGRAVRPEEIRYALKQYIRKSMGNQE